MEDTLGCNSVKLKFFFGQFLCKSFSSTVYFDLDLVHPSLFFGLVLLMAGFYFPLLRRDVFRCEAIFSNQNLMESQTVSFSYFSYLSYVDL